MMEKLQEQAALFPAESTSFAAASLNLASLTALQENVSRLVTSVISGEKCGESLASLNPDGSWARMCQGYCQVNLDGSLEAFSETWPRWGIVSDGECTELATLGLRTDETECSSWATPNAADCQGSHGGGQGRSLRTDIWRWKQGLLPTPQATPGTYDLNWEATDGRKKPNKLGWAVKMLPTPRSSPNENRQTKPTPSQLAGKHGLSLAAEVGGQLNPTFVEWLMNFPKGWTEVD
jgi:hypothetical protein